MHSRFPKMLPSDRKRTRGDAAARQNNGAAASASTTARSVLHSSTSSSLTGSFAGPLQARAVNTAVTGQTKLRPPPRKQPARERTSQTNSSSGASERSSASSQAPTASVARGRPQQPFRPGPSSASKATPTAGAATSTHRTGAHAAAVGVTTSENDANALLKATWKAKREGLEEEVRLLQLHSRQLAEETTAVEDAIEGMLIDFEADKRNVEDYHSRTVARYQALVAALRAREDVCLASKQRALTAIESSKGVVQELAAQQEATQEAIILATDQRESLEGQLTALTAKESARLAELQKLQGEEERMKDASYGLTGEVRELVMEMERLKGERRGLEVAAMEKEVARRELYSLCEELKGSIRVYCRVKGSAAAPVAGSSESGGSSVAGGGTTLSSPAKAARSGSVESTVSAGVRSTSGAVHVARNGTSLAGGLRSGRSTTRSSVAVAEGSNAGASMDEEGEGDGERCLFSFPDRAMMTVAEEVVSAEKEERESCVSSQEAEPTTTDAAVENEAEAVVAAEAGLPWTSGRAITLHTTRSNATSTGLSNAEESFVYDRVFTATAQQTEVYRDVEPLVRNAVDGYRVCVFAYGQTGSGKTFTMEGDLHRTPAAYGVTPRALQTILQRQGELAKEGWCYELSCTFIEIYNDVIRDLFQSGSAKYEAVMQQGGGAAAYHTIKHAGDRTHITNVSEKRVHSMDEFFALYQHAVDQRSTAKTELNDKSSRSHCIFTLHITGTNTTIRQRSEGVLCLVDLAGSERVNESGVQGKQFKEAVNINRSLLDLGKCIRALRSGAVVPWRNCKLTYLLQNYLGAKGAKMLMIVTVSNLRQHAPESMNSLRFAARVQETFVGTSVKRVVNMM